MTKQTEEALKMAIEWVEGWKGIAPSKIELLRVLREALEQPAQEPVLLNVKTHDDKTYKVEVSAPSWQGLSDDERFIIVQNADWDNPYDIAELIEQALKEKNTCS